MQYHLMHVCVSGLLDSVSGWEQGTRGGKKGKRKKKMQTHQPLHTALYCTALHCTVCTARSALHGRVVVSPRLASPGLALHRFVSPSQVDTYLLPLLPSAGQSPRRLLTLHYLYVA